MRQRRGKVRTARAIQRHQRAVQRRGDVHQPRIVSHHRFTGGNQDHRLLQLGFTRQIPAPGLLLAAEGGDDLFAGLVIFRRAEKRNLIAIVDKLFRQRSIVIVRPAFGRAELRAGAEADDRPIVGQVKGAAGLRLFPFVDLQLRPQQRLRQIFGAAHHAVVVGQRHVAFHHQRPGVFVQHPGVVEQAVAHLAAPAGAQRDIGKERD